MISIKISVKNIGAFKRTDKRLDNLKKELGNACFDICQDGQKQLWIEMARKNLIDTYEILKSIRAIKKSDKLSVTVISREGIYLDSMKPHWVPFDKGYAINAWALRKGYPKYQAMARAKKGFIRVFPHPFILNALSRTEAKVHEIVSRRVNLAMA